MANIIDTILNGKKGIGLFLGGVLMGTAGINILTSDDLTDPLLFHVVPLMRLPVK